ncbi:hypothetical protein Pst134EA_020815 [Puccinia striiformis f. sp. tritici]|uniref:hypothetical protein n=1 Tax=Puccinia striiformis f. sp. tritici TaxID=168172 RepID=UPI0020079003|nr:hypothetical protein Pst134EA_020815 [Puccinia striiformis f. sp. tritici]KAH9456907.1 hypothetical protein Pst134EA_020815 [Puccinia striiformis f. sp. tritici]
MDDVLTNLHQTVDPSRKPPRLMIQLNCNGVSLLCLIDTGAEINLMRQETTKKINLPLLPLPRATFINLAMDNGSTTPIVLRHYVATTLLDPCSSHSFTGIVLKLGPMKGPYDLILGTPFLAQFRLSVSIASRSLFCETNGPKILDYRLLCSKPASVAAVDTSPYPCKTSETTILDEFRDLFPVDIPAVSDEAKEAGLFRDAAFPEKMQLEHSRVRHRIILTDPKASFNERQYPYPRKHLAAWRVLLDQHIAAGRIRRSTS